MIEKYHIYSFDFLDNDFLGSNIKHRNELLDNLVKIKKDKPRFRIEIAEVITKGLDHDIIKKMYNAGVVYAQIGYESPSNNLLNKIIKKNTFASNLLYIKFATFYNVPLYHVNVLTNMPDENTDDILEAINNLRYLRFYLNPINFKHLLVPVQVNSTSKYFHDAKKNITNWMPSSIAYEYMSNLIKEGNHWDILTFIKQNHHFHWDTFKRIEQVYLNNKYSYHIEKSNELYKYLLLSNKTFFKIN